MLNSVNKSILSKITTSYVDLFTNISFKYYVYNLCITISNYQNILLINKLFYSID
jgi:hypothetical protein